MLATIMAFACVNVIAQELQPVAPLPSPQPFSEWLTSFRAEALAKGIRPDVLDAAFADLDHPDETILDRDRAQAEFTLQLDQYLKRRLTPSLIRTAQAMFTKSRTLLTEVGKRYGERLPRIRQRHAILRTPRPGKARHDR